MPSSNYRFYWPPVTRPVIAISVVTSALWLATIFSTPLRDLAMVQLSVQGSTLPAMRPWAILTYPLWHFDFLQLLFHLLALYLFGSELTREIGARRWWATLTAGALAGGLAAALVAWPLDLGYPLAGLGPATMALIAAYCWRRWEQDLNFFFIPMPGKFLFALILGFATIGPLFNGVPHIAASELAGAAAGVGVIGGRDLLKAIRLRFHYRRIQRNLKIVARNPDYDGSKRRKDGTWIN
jgi:membrane associated rhomboid family serine protease